MPQQAGSFATFLVIGPTCFFLGILFILLPYDYHVLWTTPKDRAPYFDLLESHLRFLHGSPPLISRILNIAVGTGLIGFVAKLYKPSEANLLFDGASLVLYMCGITVYIANIVKGLRMVTAGDYGSGLQVESGAPVPGQEDDPLSREDSLRVMAASNTILALVLVGVLVLQAGQWYAQRKEEAEMADIKKQEDEKKKAAKKKA